MRVSWLTVTVLIAATLTTALVGVAIGLTAHHAYQDHLMVHRIVQALQQPLTVQVPQE